MSIPRALSVSLALALLASCAEEDPAGEDGGTDDGSTGDHSAEDGDADEGKGLDPADCPEGEVSREFEGRPWLADVDDDRAVDALLTLGAVDLSSGEEVFSIAAEDTLVWLGDAAEWA